MFGNPERNLWEVSWSLCDHILGIGSNIFTGDYSLNIKAQWQGTCKKKKDKRVLSKRIKLEWRKMGRYIFKREEVKQIGCREKGRERWAGAYGSKRCLWGSSALLQVHYRLSATLPKAPHVACVPQMLIYSGCTHLSETSSVKTFCFEGHGQESWYGKFDSTTRSKSQHLFLSELYQISIVVI